MNDSKVFTCKVEDGIAVIRFSVPGSGVNTWTEGAIDEIDGVVGLLEKDRGVRGAVFISGKSDGFHAGADLTLSVREKDTKRLIQMVERIQRIFLRLEGLGVPTLAAINGPCLGGGYEFALAMTARLATDSPRTVIGLPECTVGLFPGAGGTQRLPRLIGIPAVELILKGSAVPAVKALELGMVDRVVPAGDDLLEKAKEFLLQIIGGTAELKRPRHDFSHLDGVIEEVRRGVIKAARGRELPAPMLALKAIREGVEKPLQEGLAVEKGYFKEVMTTPETGGSINTFFLKTYSDRPEKMVSSGFTPKPLKKLAVIGYGTMGRGIVIDILRRMRVPVVVKDVPEMLAAGSEFVRGVLGDMAKKGQLKVSVDDLIGLIKPMSEWTDDFKDVDLVVEAVFEDPAVKAQVYKELCAAVPADCIIASNTSSIPVTILAKDVTNPGRFGGAHFFSPVWRMELLEIIKGEETSPDTIDNLLNFCAAIKKRPVVCNDYPGFVVNAMLFHYLLKAIELVEAGVGIDVVDRAATSFGLPVGPIRLAEEIGLDVICSAFTKSLNIKCQTLENMVKAGRFGHKKSGKGFFLADGGVDPEALPYVYRQGETKIYSTSEIQDLLYQPLVKVGWELLTKGIVNEPRQVDIGAIWGAGFPADKGGPLKWADLTGLSKRVYGKDFYA